jgi:Zn-dependent peptidase ImmA (M78 family)
MQINPHIPFLSKDRLESLANALLDQFEQEIEPLPAPPVPVEKIADFLLDLNLEWLEIDDTDDEPILAYLLPGARTIRLNERRLAHFEQYPGSYEFTLAHEIGHYQLHLQGGSAASDEPYLYRFRRSGPDRREWQAEQFASYLLLPARLLWPALAEINPQHWPDLYQLRDRFQVSISALCIRLEALGVLVVTPNGQLYPDMATAIVEQRQVVRRLIGQGQFYRQLGQLAQARAVFQQALDLARDLGLRRDEALLAWSLGRLYVEIDPAYAVDLLSICVAYEREIDHPHAELDAEYVARLKARLPD